LFSDGSHIKGLVINLFAHFWPSLLKMPGFITEFITPIVKCSKGSDKNEKSICFYTIPQYENWKKINEDGKGWTIKYYKGLGTSTSLEAKSYFSQIEKHQIEFQWLNEEDDRCIELAFSELKVDARKEWLTKYQPGTFLDQNVKKLSYSDFVNKELVLFSVASNLRAIPSVVDGLKPGQRKILFSSFKRKLSKEIKVAQLAGYVSENSAYHHGEQSLASTIVGLAQNFTGSNNVNLFVPKGMFGSRSVGGKDAASPRYIFTSLSPITRCLFPIEDDALLNYLNDDGQSVEPEWYMPIIPMVLVNGSYGIGTGWSSTVYNYNPRQLISCLLALLKGEFKSALDMPELHLFFQNFKGSINKKAEHSYLVMGVIEKIDDTTIHICELPICKWTSDYKLLLEEMLTANQIKDFKEHHTDVTVSFVVYMTPEQMQMEPGNNLYKKFKLWTTLSTSNMMLFDQHGKIKKYNSPNQVLDEFYQLRLAFYYKRKQFLLDEIQHDLTKISNQARFVQAVIQDEMKIRNVKKQSILQKLVEDGYKAFPKKKKAKVIGEIDDDDNNQSQSEKEEEEENKEDVIGNGYDYLLSMPLSTLTYEKVTSLNRNREAKQKELDILINTSPESMYQTELLKLLVALDDHEELQRKADKDSAKIKAKGVKLEAVPKGIKIEITDEELLLSLKTSTKRKQVSENKNENINDEKKTKKTKTEKLESNDMGSISPSIKVESF
jgi:DNA topoisomerase-2